MGKKKKLKVTPPLSSEKANKINLPVVIASVPTAIFVFCLPFVTEYMTDNQQAQIALCLVAWGSLSISISFSVYRFRNIRLMVFAIMIILGAPYYFIVKHKIEKKFKTGLERDDIAVFINKHRLMFDRAQPIPIDLRKTFKGDLVVYVRKDNKPGLENLDLSVYTESCELSPGFATFWQKIANGHEVVIGPAVKAQVNVDQIHATDFGAIMTKCSRVSTKGFVALSAKGMGQIAYPFMLTLK